MAEGTTYPTGDHISETEDKTPGELPADAPEPEPEAEPEPSDGVPG